MLNEPLLGNCEIQLVGFDDTEAQMAYRHSSAHILGYAVENTFEDPLLTIGPSTKDGFFYDFLPSAGKVVQPEDYKLIEKSVKQIIKQNHSFERLLVTKEQALDIFSYNKYKVELIQNKVADNSITSVFKVGDFIDLCTGPHVTNTR